MNETIIVKKHGHHDKNGFWVLTEEGFRGSTQEVNSFLAQFSLGTAFIVQSEENKRITALKPLNPDAPRGSPVSTGARSPALSAPHNERRELLIVRQSCLKAACEIATIIGSFSREENLKQVIEIAEEFEAWVNR